jgi:protein TonB
MQMALYPRHAFKIDGWPSVAPAAEHRRPGHAPNRLGDWRYHGLPKPARISWLAVLFSAGVHALLLWGGGARPVRRVVAVQREPVIQMVMPPLDEEEEKPVEELRDEAEMDPGVAVPRLADLPSTVELKDAFVQPLEMSVPLQNSFDASKLTSIPLKIASPGQRPSGLKDVFNISQLDRRPEPIMQTPPEFPFSLRQDVTEARVIVEFIVDTQGVTREIRVRSSTHPGFEQSSIDGVGKWRFRPGMKGGRKVNTRMMVPIEFKVLDET